MGYEPKKSGPPDRVRISNLRSGKVENMLDEIKEMDEGLVVASSKTVLLKDVEDGLDLIEEGPEAWKLRGFASKEELLVAIHAQKGKTIAPIGLVAALERFSWR